MPNFQTVSSYSRPEHQVNPLIVREIASNGYNLLSKFHVKPRENRQVVVDVMSGIKGELVEYGDYGSDGKKYRKGGYRIEIESDTDERGRRRVDIIYEADNRFLWVDEQSYLRSGAEMKNIIIESAIKSAKLEIAKAELALARREEPVQIDALKEWLNELRLSASQEGGRFSGQESK